MSNWYTETIRQGISFVKYMQKTSEQATWGGIARFFVGGGIGVSLVVYFVLSLLWGWRHL